MTLRWLLTQPRGRAGSAYESPLLISRLQQGDKSALEREERDWASNGPWKTQAGEGHSQQLHLTITTQCQVWQDQVILHLSCPASFVLHPSPRPTAEPETLSRATALPALRGQEAWGGRVCWLGRSLQLEQLMQQENRQAYSHSPSADLAKQQHSPVKYRLEMLALCLT